MNFFTTTHIGLKKKQNEDFFGHCKTNTGDLFIICDGVGGLPQGSLASKIIVETLLQDFSNNIQNPQKLLQNSIKNAHKNTIKATKEVIGSTITAIYIENNTVYTTWCGDSRIYHFRDNAIKWISRDHNVLHDILNRGNGKLNDYKNPKAITRFIGSPNNYKTDEYIFKIKNDDYLLLCSDGLHDFILEPDIIQAITYNSPHEASAILENKLLSKEIGAPDNFTWYIIKI